MQSEKDASMLCTFFDKLCPYLISKWPSMAYLTPSLAEMLQELAEHCGIPKTCFALLNAIQKNPDSPYAGNTFFLKPKTEYYYEHFVIPIGKIVGSINEESLKRKFVLAYRQRVQQYKEDASR